MTGRSELDRKLLAAVERLGRALRAARQHLATRHRLSLLQIHLLEQLADRRARRVGELAAELDISQPTASDAIATLHDKGLVTRRRDVDDGRATVVALTARGVELATTVAAELAPLLAGDHATAADDRATALRVLLGEISRLQRAGVITVNRSCLTCHHFRPPQDGAAHCLLLDEPLADADLRLDCPDHRRVPTQPLPAPVVPGEPSRV
jgi:DNA-binding MarR family transcriptional regulator